MTTQPSIESLREALALLTEPTGWQDRHEQARNLLAAALTELSALRGENARLHQIEAGAQEMRGPVVSRDAFDVLLARIAELEPQLTTALAPAEEAEKKCRIYENDIERLMGSMRNGNDREDAERARADAAEARCQALGARGDALNEILGNVMGRGKLTLGETHAWAKAVNADLSALRATREREQSEHDAKVREPLERRIRELESKIWRWSRWAKHDRACTSPCPPDGTCSCGLSQILFSEPNQAESLRCEASAEHDARIRREALEAAAARVADRAWLIELPDSEAGYAVHFDLLNKVILSPAPDAAKPNNQQEQP